jgi:RNA polymerase sigma factor (sigma-70 family)
MALPRRASADHASLFLDRYQQLLNDARRIAGQPDAARDLVHDAFVQFVSQAPPLETVERVDAYLHGMLRKLHLSRRRRASVRLELAVSDYDSLDTALRLRHPERRMEVAHQLAAVCGYACVRKESSKTGSVLILRFFRGLYPEEIARISGLSTESVAQWLRLARAEARVALEAPGRIGFMRHAGTRVTPVASMIAAARGSGVPHFASADLRASDGPEVWVAALRQAIAASRRGPCLSEEESMRTLRAAAMALRSRWTRRRSRTSRRASRVFYA